MIPCLRSTDLGECKVKLEASNPDNRHPFFKEYELYKQNTIYKPSRGIFTNYVSIGNEAFLTKKYICYKINFKFVSTQIHDLMLLCSKIVGITVEVQPNM